jgi:hypothetical protein
LQPVSAPTVTRIWRHHLPRWQSRGRRSRRRTGTDRSVSGRSSRPRASAGGSCRPSGTRIRSR